MALSSEEIKSKINKLNADKNNANYDRQNYMICLNNANKLVKSLNDSLNSLTMANDNMKKYFLLNDKTADGGEIKKTKEQINHVLKNLNNVIIPCINNNISNLKNKIIAIDTEIRKLQREYETM